MLNQACSHAVEGPICMDGICWDLLNNGNFNLAFGNLIKSRHTLVDTKR